MADDNGFVVTTVRKILNVSLQGTTPGQLIDAIRTDASLMGGAADHVQYYAGLVPPFAMTMAGRQLSRVNSSYPGGLFGLIMDWLATDQPVYHSLILNTEGGKEWLKTQVREILDGLGIRIEGEL